MTNTSEQATPLQLRNRDDIVLRLEHLVVNFQVGKQTVQAVSDVSLDVALGETLGLVGESGCGKSTVGRAIMQLPPPSAGRVLFKGQDLSNMSGEALRQTRTGLQMIFQDPISSLNPRRKV
ncbi:MAG: ATP-binding cassette domain-containing protein, partial [Pseudohongiella sp.]|nr:ATP-binding cassette domain-containing protein [Pseudohongiella sp.]